MSAGLRRRVFARSLLLQGAWSFERMQNLGFLFALEPALERAHGPRRAEAAQRHLEYFNTQPYMSGFALGAAAGMEERLSRETDPARAAAAAERLSAVKRSLASGLAALGDRFFWGSLRPACAAAAVAAWGILWTLDVPFPVLAGCLLYLALFNAAALWTRWEGLRIGFEEQESLPKALGRWPWQSGAAALRTAGLVLVGSTALAALIVPPWGSFTPWNLAVLAACLALKARGICAARIYAGLCALGVIIGALT
ncbi:MAG: PTS system mannose/fructose/sorbose family transporter subunit IID [Elusimicrobiota bacterium]